jgi:hypothetical protein
MRYLNQFEQHLRDCQKKYAYPPMERSVLYMERVKNQIEHQLKNAAMTPPNPELARQTIEKFFRWVEKPLTENFNWFEVAILCHGLSMDIPEHDSIIRKSDSTRIFLSKFYGEYKNQILNFYPWQGLLNTYFNVSLSDREQDLELQASWIDLRGFLDETLDTMIQRAAFKPCWLDALMICRIILTENATKILAEQALQGKMELVNQITRDINIPETSWFWPDLLMSQIKVISDYSDELFKQHIDTILSQLQEHAACLDHGLAILLNRYSRCEVTEKHQGLRIAVVNCWKSPSLGKDYEWERVTPEAKKMVQRWLAQEDITEILGDLIDDKRRYEFWLQFLYQIEYTFIWLGKEAREKYPHLLKNRKGRCAQLHHAGRPDNNVILMKIRDVFIIESGAKAGGKCWGYRSDKILPLLQQPGIDYDVFRDMRRNVLSSDVRGGDGLVHAGYGWEDKFLHVFSNVHIKPDDMNIDEIVNRYGLRKIVLPSGTVRIEINSSFGETLANMISRHGFVYSGSNVFHKTQRQ